MQAAKKRSAKLEAKGNAVNFKDLLRMEPDSGTTNIRNTNSKRWQRWLGIDNRCVVPFTSFSEFNKAAGGDIWFAIDETRPLPVFAGIWTRWTSVRKVKRSRRARRPTSCTAYDQNDANIRRLAQRMNAAVSVA
jgi:putative SOS response-associated peptidase YedK